MLFGGGWISCEVQGGNAVALGAEIELTLLKG